jgi:hypothetical protein
MKHLFQTTAILLLVTFCVIQKTSGQTKDELLSTYNNQTIHTFGKFFIKGSNRLTFGDLKKDFTSDIAKGFYKKAKDDRFLGGFFTVTAVGALVTSILVRKNNNTLGNILSVSAIGLNFGSLHFRHRSTQLVDQAIWYRNKEILFGAKE